MENEVLETYELDNEFVFFKHSNESMPFLAIRCDKMEVYHDYVKLYSKEYIDSICTVSEYEMWYTLKESDPFLLRPVQIKYLEELDSESSSSHLLVFSAPPTIKD